MSMRGLVLSCVAVAVVAGSAWGADGGVVVASAMCSAPFSCDKLSGGSGLDNPFVAALIEQIKPCIARNIVQDSNEPFDYSMGLDYNNCLTSRPVAKAKLGLTMTPRCCVIKTEGSNCQMQCSLLGRN